MHMDAGGYCTFLRILLGLKLWFMARDCPAVVNKDFDVRDYIWDLAVLDQGDDLCVFLCILFLSGALITWCCQISNMRPGVLHFVASTEDSAAVGGHYHFSRVFSCTMKAMLMEHFFGQEITNTEHLTSGVALLHILAGYCCSWDDDSCKRPNHSNAYSETNVSCL